MEWIARQHLDLRRHAHSGAFHPVQPLFAAAMGTTIVEYDILTGCKLSSVDIGGPVIRMAYSPAGGHVIVAVLEDLTIRSWDLDTEHTYILYSPPDVRRTDKPAEVHIALTPLRRWLFFAAHRRSVINVVGTVEGLRPATKLKTDQKKHITGLACHTRLPFLYVAYADGIIRAHSLESFAVVYVLAVEDISIKLAGAGAMTFHPTLLLMFVGDRTGTLMAWDISTPTRTNLVGLRSISTEAITAVHWHASLQLLLTLTHDGIVQGWRAQIHQNANNRVGGGQFFNQADLEQLDIARILSRDRSRSGGSTQRVKDLLLHPRLNIATLLFLKDLQTEDEASRDIVACLSRESRRKLMAVLQAARGTAGAAQREKLASLGAAGLLSEQQLQQQLILHHGQSKITQPTALDFARRAILYGTTKQLNESKGTIQALPLLAIADPIEPLHDLPVCEPFQTDFRFFNSEQGIFNYPSRVILMDGCNLFSYNLAGSDASINLLKKMPPVTKGGVQRVPRHMVYSSKQQAFLIFFDCRGGPGEVVVYRYLDVNEPIGEGMDTLADLRGRDGCWTGKHDSQFAILEDDGYGFVIYDLENANMPEVPEEQAKPPTGIDQREALNEDDFVTRNIFNYGQQFDDQTDGAEEEASGGPVLCAFETPVQRIFGMPLPGTILYVSAGSHIGTVQIPEEGSGRAALLATKRQDGQHVKLQPAEIVLQVRWQAKQDSAVAGVITTQRVMIISARMELLASSAPSFDQSYPPFRSLLWVGPSLFFSTATTVAMLGWDSIVRPLVTIDSPTAVLVGVLNDRVLLAQRSEGGTKSIAVEVCIRLLGLLEPLLLGWVTLLQARGPDPAIDLHEITFQLTSRFDSQRITPRLVEALSHGPPICSDLAVELSQSGPQFTQELRCLCAIRARKFHIALNILKDEFLRLPEYPCCPPNSRLFHRFRDLGHACIKYGQFDQAKEVFDTVGDYESQFDVFLAHMNPSALRLLSQKLEESGADPDLKRQCEQVLLVRSAGWSNGSAFMNLGGENLAPRGPEWGGGNWPLKTVPEESKLFPKWELSGSDITAYMKTPAGAIPVITPDSVGVYLGTEKGRGTVVEVVGLESKRFGDDRLGGKLGKAATQDDVDAAVVKALLEGPLPKHVVQNQSEDSEETEAQRRAEEEFKRGHLPIGSDSDNEDTTLAQSGRSRLAVIIREKNPSEGTVRDSIDVERIKSSISSFRIGDLPVPKSSVGKASTSSVLASREGISTFPQEPTPFQPLWGPTPNQSQKSQQGGVPSQAVALGYAQPHYPPGAPPPGSTPPYTNQGGGGGDPFGDGGQFVAQPTASSQSQLEFGSPSLPVSESDIQSNASQPQPHNLPSGGPHSLDLDSLLQPSQRQDLGLAGGIPPMAPVSGPSPAQEFGGLLSGNSTDQVGPLKIPTIKSGASSTQELPPGVVDLGGVMGPLPPVIVNSSDAVDLGLLAALNTDSMGETGSTGGPPGKVTAGQIPRGAAASTCFKAALSHVEENRLKDAQSCLDEAFLSLAKDRSVGKDIGQQAKICAQYKVAVLLLQEIARLQKAEGQGAMGAKEEMARLARQLASLPLQARHRISCLRTAIKRNMEVQNWAYAKRQLDLLLSKAPPQKQGELRALANVCTQRGLTDRTVQASEDASQFCFQTLLPLPTIGHDRCATCRAAFSHAAPGQGCALCGMGPVTSSHQAAANSPF